MKRIGIYNPYLESKGGGEKVCLAMASVLARQGNEVTLVVYKKVKLKELGHYFDLDLSGIKLATVKPNVLAKVINRLPLPGGIRHFFSDTSVFRAIKKMNFDVFVNNCFQSNLPNPAKRGIYMCMFPQKIIGEKGKSPIRRLYLFVLRCMYRLILPVNARHAVNTYDVITANSKFTQGYIKKYWNIDSTILYPLCDSMDDPGAGKKEKIILHVGRFFERNESNHHKRQDFLLHTFKQMRNINEAGWQLHFAGSVAEDVGGLKYILALMKDGAELPVYFHFNCSFKELKDLYNKAAIYWHATGYGANANKRPESQEHFGISTVEAMSTGCIPVVIDSAGQKESVISGDNGYLWNSEETLIKYTDRVIGLSEKELDSMRTRARQSADHFGAKQFEQHVLSLFEF